MTAWTHVPIVESDEPLVPIGPFSEYPRILSSAIYAGERLDSPYQPDGLSGSMLTPFVRAGVAQRLDAMARALPPGLVLLVWDSYRSIATQVALYEYLEQQLIGVHPDWSAERIATEVQRYVAQPSRDPATPAPHNTGGAIDLTLVHMHHGPSLAYNRALKTIHRARELGEWKDEYRATLTIMDLARTQTSLLPMGTAFDEVAAATAADHYTGRQGLSGVEREAAANREFLRVRMEAVGFHRYSEEWWHFSFGDQAWAHARGTNACYGAVDLSAANRRFERLRRAHHHLQRAWADGREIDGSVPDRYVPAVEFARELAPRFSDPRMSVHPPAHRL